MLSYLIFGVLTTLLNIVLYALFSRLFGYTAANSWGNVLDNALCILFAYCTNRAFVFRSKTTGKAMAKEFGTFVTCRLGTMVLDAVIMIVGGNLLAAQGAALMDEACRGVLSRWPTGLAGYGHTDGSLLCRYTGGFGSGWLCRGRCHHWRGGRPDSRFCHHQRITAQEQALWGAVRQGILQRGGRGAELCVQQADHL